MSNVGIALGGGKAFGVSVGTIFIIGVLLAAVVFAAGYTRGKREGEHL